METVLEFTKNVEENITSQIKTIIDNIKKTYLEEAYKGIEDMYDIKPLEGVQYDKCVMIPSHQGSFYCAPFKLPSNEYVIYKNEQHHRINNQTDCWYCVIITNYGRILHTLPIWPSSFGGYTYFSPISDTTVANSTHGQCPSGHTPITICEPLPYKLPKFAFQMTGLTKIQAGPTDAVHFTKFSDEYRNIHSFTRTIQEYCKEYYILIGKWQPYIEKNINIDFDKLREDFETQKKDNIFLENKVENLVNENDKLKVELENMKNLYIKLKEEQKDYNKLVEWKTILNHFLDENIDKHRKKDGTFATPKEIKILLENYNLITNDEWEEACDAMDQVDEFKKYQEMQKKFGQFGTTIKNTAIGVKKGKSKNNT